MSLPIRLPSGALFPSLASAARALGITREALRRRILRDPDAYAEPEGTVGATCAGGFDGAPVDCVTIQVDES